MRSPLEVREAFQREVKPENLVTFRSLGTKKPPTLDLGDGDRRWSGMIARFFLPP
jgi:hypothetical protein